MGNMFYGCSNLSSLDLGSFNTSNVTGMGWMFDGCSNLSGLDVGSFNTTDVTNMESMFSGCSNLSSLDLSNFNTINVTRMSSMFSGCSNLGSLDLNSFNTSKITDMSYMFSGCSSLSSLGLSSFNTSKVTNMRDMFTGCGNLSSLNLSSFNISNVTAKLEIWDMFSLSTIYAPCGLKVSVSLPTYWESGFKEEWRLPNGTVVTELPRNLTRSVKLRKYRIAEQSPDEGSSDDQLKYVQKLTQVSLKNADAESKESIQNAIYNLLFKAEYRPMESKIPGDAMVYTGSRDVIARWPIQNKDYGTSVFWANTVTDAKLGTITYNTSSAGCMSYACFATAYVYGTSGNCVWIESPNAESVRDFIRSYADPGEQLRYGMPHSIVFLGEDADGDGFYYINYNGGDDGEGHLYHDLYVGSYARYADFAAVTALYNDKRLYIYDTNNGSYYNNTAASVADVRNGKGAARIVTRLACPIEATIELNGEILDSRNPGSASFGTVARNGEEVVFTLDYSPDYRLTVTGTGEGGMTLTLEYYGEDETLIDRRRFVDMPIKTETEIESGGFDPQASFVLYKSDNMGEAEAWGAGIGETVYGANNIYRGDNASTPDSTPIITFDANGGTIGAEAVAVIATNEDAMISALPEAVRDGYVFKGWYTSPMHGIKVDETRIYMENTTLYAQWEKTGGNTPGDNDPGDDTPGSDVPAGDIPEGGIPEGLWIAGIGDMAYTGRPVKPEVRVYDSDRRLKEGKDYTISYKNNTKAADAVNSAKPPTVVVKGKGNYTGTETATFNILPISLEDSSVTAQDLTVAYNGSVQKKAVTVMFNGKKLSAGKDYTVSYPALTQGVAGAYQEEGTYDILLTAKTGGNFSGTRTVKLTITKATLISKATVKKIPNQHYTGGAVVPKPTVTLKKATLTEGTDYTVSYDNNTEAGTATVVLTGIGAYAGTKRVTFKIIGTSLKGVDISGIETKVYNGAEQTQNISIRTGSVILEEDVDYELSYNNNKNAGKATVTIKGINAYTGTIKKTFQITAYDMKENSGSQIKGLDSVITVKYLKGGSRPTLELTFGDKTLIEGKDYTLAYKNNKAVTFANTVRKPVITIKGKGNFKGSLDKTFTIESKNLNDPEYPVKMSVADKSFINKAGKYISKPELTDADGKKLVAGKDYEKEISYTLEDGTVLTGKSKVAAETNVIVTVTGKGAYSGELKTSYRITKSDFSKANIRITSQIYTGKKITLDKDSVTVKIGKDTLSFGTDYEIVEGSYVNNTEKGTAKVKIVGKGNYGGTKTVSFRITARKFSWFFRLFQ
ncbi:MAG: BspA family leucine-rich repeat surface protein, partial [Lachnospiraceae bacterium]|nr:BspA family leucine-rich repeat surface protein [Lachnospiraceae bacterium]